MADRPPGGSHSRPACEARLAEYINSSSEIPVFGHSDIDFNADWKVPLADPGRPRGSISFRFSSFHGDLSSVSRAFILRVYNSNNMKPGAGQHYMRAFEFLSRAMRDRGCMSVIDLTPSIFSLAKDLIEKFGYRHNTMAEHCTKLQKFAREIVAHEICLLKFDWSQPHRSDYSPDVFSQEARAKEKAFLPARSSLQALADVRPLMEQELRAGSLRARTDLIIFWIVVIIFATGSRVNEILCLEHKFLIKKDIIGPDGRMSSIYHLRRTTSKGGPSDARPLSPFAAKLCRRAQKYLMLLTRPARAVLEGYAEHRNVAPEWSARQTAALSGIEVANYLQIKNLNNISKVMKRLSNNGTVTLDDIVRFLNHKQSAYVSGRDIREITKKYFPIMVFWTTRGTPRLAERVARFIEYSDVRNFLAGNSSGLGSVFSRYLGAEHYLAAHQLRRLMDTSVREGGISENELAVLQGRANPAQSAVYDYRTPDERARDVKLAIRTGEAFGWVADAYWSMPSGEREEFLGSVVQVAYRTSVGHCLTNISEDPCPYHLQCLSGCGDFLHIKGDQKAIEGLTDHKRWATGALNHLADAEATDRENASVQNHQSHLRRQLKTIDRVLAIESDPAHEVGSKVKIYPNNEKFSEENDEWR